MRDFCSCKDSVPGNITSNKSCRRLLGQLAAQPEGPAADAVGLLALIAGQDVEPAQDSDGCDGRWRIARRTAPDRVVSVTDPDARHVHKNRTRHQEGFKGDSSQPRLAGQERAYMEKTMTDFRTGVRANNPGMTDLMKAITEQDIAALAAYIAGL